MEIYTPETSANGKRNAYHNPCEVVGHYRPYAARLNLCSGTKAEHLNEIYGECLSHIKKQRCPALAMKQEEKLAGRAIYFVERMRFEDQPVHLGVFETVSTPSKKRPVKSLSTGKSSVIDKIDTGTYADAINAEIGKVATPAAPVVPTIKIEAIPGESPLEMARRLMALNKGETQ